MDPQRQDVEAQDPSVRPSTSGSRLTPPQQLQRIINVPLPVFLVFLLVGFMLVLNHNSDEFLAKHQYQDSLDMLNWQRSNLSAWLNGTESNVDLPYQNRDISSILRAFGIRGGLLDTSVASYYPNITGFIHGELQLFNITPPELRMNNATWAPTMNYVMANANMSQVVEKSAPWNWTASEKIAISVMEKKPPKNEEFNTTVETALIHGRVEFSDPNAPEDLKLEFEGIHFIQNGSVYGFAEPYGRAIDVRQLATLVPAQARNLTAQIIVPELSSRIDKLNEFIAAGVVEPESSNEEAAPKPQCGFKLFGQIEPMMIPQAHVAEVEKELLHPTGLQLAALPKMKMKGIMISEECGIMFELKDALGMRAKKFYRKITTYAGTAAASYFIMLMLFVSQAEQSRTPSGLTNLSRWSFLSQSCIDAVSFAGYITFAILLEGRTSLALIAPAFLACLLFIQEAKLALQMQRFQVPEASPVRPSPPPPPTTQTTQPPRVETSPSLPPSIASHAYPPRPRSMSEPLTSLLPHNSRSTNGAQQSPAAPTSQPQTRPQPPPVASNRQTRQEDEETFFQFLIHHIRTDPQARLYVGLLLFLTVVVRVILSPLMSMVFIASSYSSLWLPQIIRSAQRVRASGLSPKYIVGVTVCRLYFMFYFLSCPENVLEIEPKAWAPFLGAFVVLQSIILLLQDYFGPAFFLPSHYIARKVYDYHPPMPLPDREAPDQSLGDCSICMDAIIVDTFGRKKSLDGNGKDKSSSDAARASGAEIGTGSSFAMSRAAGQFISAVQQHVGAASAKKAYSLAPCHHLFHTECLERWLAIKNICPQCRRPLPPL